MELYHQIYQINAEMIIFILALRFMVEMLAQIWCAIVIR